MIRFLHWVGNNLTGIAAIGTFATVVVGQYRHRKHEATSDDTNAKFTIFLNGEFQTRIDEAVKRARNNWDSQGG